jgi:hypothetical protein
VVDLGVEATDHTPLAQRAQANERGRGRNPDALGEVLVGDPRVRGDKFQDRAIDGVDGRLWMIRHMSSLAAQDRIIFGTNRIYTEMFGKLCSGRRIIRLGR